MEPFLWCIKYRPKSWDDFTGQDQAITQLQRLAASKTCPNLILYGPYGTGKTRAAEVYAREFLGDTFTANFKYLNVRDIRTMPISKAKRSISDIAKLGRGQRTELDEYMSTVYREAKMQLKVKGKSRGPNRSQLLQSAIRMFASTMTVSDELVKILVLDEADALDMNMQQALRRTMEIYSQVCRFILITPSLSGWSPAIISRCLMIRFPQPNDNVVHDLIENIASKEDVQIDTEAIEEIASKAHGDMRRAINLLQITAAGSNKVTRKHVLESAETPLIKGVRIIVDSVLQGSFLKARKKLRELLALDGYSPSIVCLEIQRDLVKRPLNPELLSGMLDRVAEIDYRIAQAKNPFIQLTALLATLGRLNSAASC